VRGAAAARRSRAGPSARPRSRPRSTPSPSRRTRRRSRARAPSLASCRPRRVMTGRVHNSPAERTEEVGEHRPHRRPDSSPHELSIRQSRRAASYGRPGRWSSRGSSVLGPRSTSTRGAGAIRCRRSRSVDIDASTAPTPSAGSPSSATADVTGRTSAHRRDHYIRTWEGWLYLASVMDLYSRRIVGWALADHLRAELVVDALEMAVARRRPDAGLVHHSDQGSTRR